MFRHEEPETSDFASQGFESVRNTYLDYLKLAYLTDDRRWTDTRLNDEIADYEEFLRGDIMTHAREYGERNLAHMKFERDCRLGKYACNLFEESEGVEPNEQPDNDSI